MGSAPDKKMIVGLDIGTSKVVAIVGEIGAEGDIEVQAAVKHDLLIFAVGFRGYFQTKASFYDGVHDAAAPGEQLVDQLQAVRHQRQGGRHHVRRH